MRTRPRDPIVTLGAGGTVAALLAATAALAALSGCVSPHGGDGGPADAAEDGGSPAGPLHVLTWNLREFPLAAGTVVAVAAILEDLRPDVVAVQEVTDPLAFARLADGVPGFSGLLNEDPGSDFFVGLLYREDRVEVLQSATVFTDDWYAFPRPPLVASLRTRLGDPSRPFDFVAMVLHLKAQVDSESRERRRAACERLEAWIAERVSRGGEDDYVLLGDWNDELTDGPGDNVFGAFLDRPDSYRFLTREAAEAGDATYLPFGSFIDHVLVTSSALEDYGARGTTEVLHLDQTVEAYTSTVSDHRPVLSVFSP